MKRKYRKKSSLKNLLFLNQILSFQYKFIRISIINIIFNPYFTKYPSQSYIHTQITKNIHKSKKNPLQFSDDFGV
jgi:hypothetical protein